MRKINWTHVLLIVIGGIFGYAMGLINMFLVMEGMLPWQ